MATSESPAVARRRLRLALRKAREAKALTQGEVADALEWSLSKVNRIEAGDVTVSNTDLQALMTLLGIADPAHRGGLVEAARASRRRGWWDEPRYRAHLTAATLQLLQFESEATVIRVFQPTLIPGLLQTQAYAGSVINFWSHELSEENRATRLEVRMHRRAQVLERTDSPWYLVILDESVLSRKVGGAQVMAEQLQELLKLIKEEAVIVRVVPLADAAVMAMVSAFSLFDLGDDENAVLYREGDRRDELLHQPELIGRYRTIFERMWNVALTAEASALLIEERAEAMLAAAGDERRVK